MQSPISKNLSFNHHIQSPTINLRVKLGFVVFSFFASKYYFKKPSHLYLIVVILATYMLPQPLWKCWTQCTMLHCILFLVSDFCTHHCVSLSFFIRLYKMTRSLVYALYWLLRFSLAVIFSPTVRFCLSFPRPAVSLVKVFFDPSSWSEPQSHWKRVHFVTLDLALCVKLFMLLAWPAFHCKRNFASQLEYSG